MECCTKELKIDIQNCSEDSLENLLERKLRELPQKASESESIITIPRIPNDILETNKTYYEPRVVSIGPYYHGGERYRDAEQHKMRYLRDFLNRHNHVGLEHLINAIRPLEAKARRCYSGYIRFDSERFVQMLVLDACFILELWSKKKFSEEYDDALLETSWVFNRIITDLLLLQNQIPFFVIHKIYGISYNKSRLSDPVEYCSDPILYDLTRFVQWRAPMWVWPHQFQIPECEEIYHLLHFYQEFYVPKKNKKVHITSDSTGTCSKLIISRSIQYLESIICSHEAEQNERDIFVLPSATDLWEAGVLFRKKRFPENFLDITFKNGVFELPMIGSSLEEKITVLNLVAWNSKVALKHNKHPNQPSNSCYLFPLMSYTILLESLLRTKNDVQLLKAQGIIENSDPSDEQLANFFNHLGDLNVICGDSIYHAELFSDIKRYYNRRWHRYRAKLKRDYFHNPWSIISVAAAIILLFLTGIQAFCAIYPVACH